MVFKEVLLDVWCCVQLFIADVYLAMVDSRVEDIVYREGVTYYIGRFYGAVSIGNSVFMNSRYRYSDYIMKHEYGHTIQSRILGIFYIPIIAIPSLLWAVFHTFATKVLGLRINYFWFYTEKWANKLGGN